MKKINSSLYVHVPFCDHICSYCDFCKMFYDEKVVDNYLGCLFEELNNLNVSKLKTIYIGGGTPSCLSVDQLDRLLSKLNKYLDDDYEFSIEVNPESVCEDKIKLFRKYGINRVSIGVQSFDDGVLKLLNRKHNFEDVKNCVSLLSKYDINNYSMDFIYGIKGFKVDYLDKVFSLKPKHLSFYSLILEDNTLLKINNYEEEEQDKVREEYDYIYNELKKYGYNRYEVSNFCLKGYECKHNLVYWHNEEYYAIGAGASSYVNGVRYTSSKSITKYVKGIVNKEKEVADREKEEIMLRLRLDEGINLNDYKSIFNGDFLIKYERVVEELVSKGLVEIKDNCLKTTYEGMMLLDSVLIKLMWGGE